jgi:hypothetical protein
MPSAKLAPGRTITWAGRAAAAGAANVAAKASNSSSTAVRDKGMGDHLGERTAILPFRHNARSSRIGSICAAPPGWSRGPVEVPGHGDRRLLQRQHQLRPPSHPGRQRLSQQLAHRDHPARHRSSLLGRRLAGGRARLHGGMRLWSIPAPSAVRRAVRPTASWSAGERGVCTRPGCSSTPDGLLGRLEGDQSHQEEGERRPGRRELDPVDREVALPPRPPAHWPQSGCYVPSPRGTRR